LAYKEIFSLEDYICFDVPERQLRTLRLFSKVLIYVLEVLSYILSPWTLAFRLVSPTAAFRPTPALSHREEERCGISICPESILCGRIPTFCGVNLLNGGGIQQVSQNFTCHVVYKKFPHSSPWFWRTVSYKFEGLVYVGCSTAKLVRNYKSCLCDDV
jgi:hypothetical protein